MKTEHEPRETLCITAREYATGNATDGDLIAAAIRYTADLIKTWGYRDLVRDLENVAKGAEDEPYAVPR